MSDDEQINQYLQRVRSQLVLSREQRRRAIEEIGYHLDDAVTTHQEAGSSREQAIALALGELGPPHVVALEFNVEAASTSPSSSRRYWLPLVPPLALFAVAIAVLLASVTWILDGWSAGERTLQQRYITITLGYGVLSLGAYLSVRRARLDADWLRAAWFCSALALATAAIALY